MTKDPNFHLFGNQASEADINSSSHSGLACRLFCSKPLHEPMLTYCQMQEISVKFESKYKNFIRENSLENAVCEM